MSTWLWASAGAAGLYGLHRLALFAEDRGWIYYKHRRGSSGALGNALLQVHAVLEPSKQHVVDESVREQREDGESGDPPSGGSRVGGVS